MAAPTETSPPDLARASAVTGVRPTPGGAHLGHFVGNIRPMLRHHGAEQKIFILADLHGPRSTSSMMDDALSLTSDVVASGIDPSEVALVPQSQIQTNLLPFFYQLCGQASFTRLLRLPAIKGLFRGRSAEVHVDDLLFPLVQASDLLAFRASVVFSNADNRSLIEFTHQLVRRINRIYDLALPEPQLISGEVPYVPGIDGQKMSKAKNNCIFLADSSDVVRKKVMSMFTDPSRVHADIPGNPDTNPVFILHRLFNDAVDEIDDMADRYRRGAVGDGEVKDRLVLALERFLAPIRAKRESLLLDRSWMSEALRRGAAVADQQITQTLSAIYNAREGRLLTGTECLK